MVFIINNSAISQGHRLHNLTTSVFSLLILSKFEFICCTELRKMASTVTLDVGLNLREAIDLSALLARFLQLCDIITQPIAK